MPLAYSTMSEDLNSTQTKLIGAGTLQQDIDDYKNSNKNVISFRE